MYVCIVVVAVGSMVERRVKTVYLMGLGVCLYLIGLQYYIRGTDPLNTLGRKGYLSRPRVVAADPSSRIIVRVQLLNL